MESKAFEAGADGRAVMARHMVRESGGVVDTDQSTKQTAMSGVVPIQRLNSGRYGFQGDIVAAGGGWIWWIFPALSNPWKIRRTKRIHKYPISGKATFRSLV